MVAVPLTLLIATTNRHKAREISEILSPFRYVLKTLADFDHVPEVIEDGSTFEENALKKAKTYADAFGILTLADDSGLEVDALDGAPGVFSARYAGEGAPDHALYQKLLQAMIHVPNDQRTAQFHCVLALVDPSTDPKTIHGIVEGQILREPRGHNGFGYDPVFFYPPLNQTFAELKPEIKNTISHRGRALKLLQHTFRKQFAVST